MLVGIDVTHPSPGSASTAPSVAGIVASVDGTLAQLETSGEEGFEVGDHFLAGALDADLGGPLGERSVPSPGSASTAPSVAGIVASVDGTLAQWPAEIRVQGCLAFGDYAEVLGAEGLVGTAEFEVDFQAHIGVVLVAT
jgi:hypothetical protein